MFFFQAEDGIRDIGVTGVQTCVLFRSARGEVGDAAAGFFDYYATFERAQVGTMFAPDEPNEHLLVRSVPYGVVVGIIPWNYPAALFARKVAPAIMAGNTIVLKPHEDTPLSALALAVRKSTRLNSSHA